MDRYHPYTWAPKEIANRWFSVTASHVYHVGGEYYGREITAMEFFTGFPGCPTRYIITTADGRRAEHRDESSTPTMWSK